MLVIYQPTVSQLAKGFRRNLAGQGVVLGHQSSLNLCIAALGAGSPNKVAAILAERPLLLAPPRLPEPWPMPDSLALQIARLALWDAKSHSSAEFGRVPGPTHLWSENRSIKHSDAAGLLSAACKMTQLTAGNDGGPWAGFAMELAPSGSTKNSTPFPFLLSVRQQPHLAPDAQNTTQDVIVNRVLDACARRPDLKGVSPYLLGGQFWKAFSDTVFVEDFDNNRLDSLTAAIAAAYDFVAPLPGLGTARSLGGPGLETLPHVLLTAFAAHELVGIRWPDGRLASLHADRLDEEDEAIMNKVPNAVTEAAMQEARAIGRGRFGRLWTAEYLVLDLDAETTGNPGLTAERIEKMAGVAQSLGMAMISEATSNAAEANSMGQQYCLGTDSLAGRIGLHLFSEVRDGQEFHTFDFGADPEVADLIAGEFEWLPLSASRNAAVRHALFGLASCGLDGNDGEALEADIDAFLQTDIQRDGTDPVGVTLLRRAVAELDSTNSSYEEAYALLKQVRSEFLEAPEAGSRPGMR